jgi:hypothetical protein
MSLMSPLSPLTCLQVLQVVHVLRCRLQCMSSTRLYLTVSNNVSQSDVVSNVSNASMYHACTHMHACLSRSSPQTLKTKK